MVEIIENLFIGNSGDGYDRSKAYLLNVAQDLPGVRGWPTCTYEQVALVDGPGNPLTSYIAAVMLLFNHVKLGTVMVYCHEGSRSLTVVLMYLHIVTGLGWDGCLQMVRERVEEELPVPHEAHREAFAKINWPLIRTLVQL